MSDEERKDQAAPPPPPAMGVDRVEFRRAMNDAHRQTGEQFASLREDAGIVLFSIGLCCCLGGFALFKDARK